MHHGNNWLAFLLFLVLHFCHLDYLAVISVFLQHLVLPCHGMLEIIVLAAVKG